MRSLRCAVVGVAFAGLVLPVVGCTGSDGSAGSNADATATSAAGAGGSANGDNASPLDAVGGHNASVSVTYTVEGDGSGADPSVDALAVLEQSLTDALEPTGLGELAADRFGSGTVTVTVMGPSLDPLWSTARPIFERYPGRPATAELRVGGPDGDVERVDL